MDGQELYNLHEAYMKVVANEAYKRFPKGRVDKKMASKAVGAVKHQFAATWGDQENSSQNQEIANKLGSQAKKMAQISTEKNKEANSRRRGVWSKHKTEVKRRTKYMDDIARQQRERGYGSTTKKEQVDLYDIILSHLLDEGYAETLEAAEVMMVNMSEEWRDSIVDEFLDEAEKPFPYEKVKAKQIALRDKGGKSLDRRMKMGMSVRRAKEAEKTGGSQQDAGKGWYHGR